MSDVPAAAAAIMTQKVGCMKVLEGADLVFWDFDGVIKDSVAVKSDAFEHLFQPYGPEIAKRVRRHHEAYTGVSRYEKIPIYLAWAGEAVTSESVQTFCDRFAGLVRQRVIDAPWIPGVAEYLEVGQERQAFVLVTATPRDEIEHILAALKIARCFREVHGAPTTKCEAIRGALQRWRLHPENALMVGDSESDLDAAAANGVAFVLRHTALNSSLQEKHVGAWFETL